jgi:hypothetical protein
MKNSKLLLILISIGLLLLNTLPQVLKELYVQSTGSFDQTDTLYILIAIFGLFYKWKYLKELLLIATGLTLLVSLISTVSMLINDGVDFRPGWIVNLVLSSMVVIMLLKLRKIE